MFKSYESSFGCLRVCLPLCCEGLDSRESHRLSAKSRNNQQPQQEALLCSSYQRHFTQKPTKSKHPVTFHAYSHKQTVQKAPKHRREGQWNTLRLFFFGYISSCMSMRPWRRRNPQPRGPHLEPFPQSVHQHRNSHHSASM